MKPEYEPKGLRQTIDYLIEECGEVVAAAGKFNRWGPESYNPEISGATRQLEELRAAGAFIGSSLEAVVRTAHPGETNRQWLLRELDDLERAIARARVVLAVIPEGE